MLQRLVGGRDATGVAAAIAAPGPEARVTREPLSDDMGERLSRQAARAEEARGEGQAGGDAGRLALERAK